uniref:ATP synthase protein 8 n=1 Tax=Metschnikowia hawaiiana TaxID=197672 RepID=A0A7H1CNP2_9ASCO|nr:Atp8 [Metschnikowia hawaiiana]QNS23088.1 Atp8 [Metschnikowia hawaiiana]
MPQLVPFYFLHLLTFGILVLTLLMFMTSKYLLPNILRLLIARMLMIKL